MSKIGLKEVAELVDKLDASELSMNDDVQEYFSAIHDVGGEILRTIPKEQFLSAVVLLESMVIVDLISESELGMAIFCMKDANTFGMMMAMVLKLSVGIAALEEWH